MRISPCWIHPRFSLLRVTSRLQLGLHVRFGLSWPPWMETLISPSYDVETRRSLMRWKKTTKDFFWFLFKLQKIRRSFCVTTIRCCVTYFGPGQPYIVSGLKPRLRTPQLVALNPRTFPFDINSVAAVTLGFGFCLVLVFHRETDLFHYNFDVESFCCESGPPLWRLVLLW
jgi:hypothetical protein